MKNLENKSLFSNETLDSIAMAKLYGGIEAEANKTYCGLAKCNCPYTYCNGAKCSKTCTCVYDDAIGATFTVGATEGISPVLRTD